MKNGKQEKGGHLLYLQALWYECMGVRRTVNCKGMDETGSWRKHSQKSLTYRVLTGD